MNVDTKLQEAQVWTVELVNSILRKFCQSTKLSNSNIVNKQLVVNIAQLRQFFV